MTIASVPVLPHVNSRTPRPILPMRLKRQRRSPHHKAPPRRINPAVGLAMVSAFLIIFLSALLILRTSAILPQHHPHLHSHPHPVNSSHSLLNKPPSSSHIVSSHHRRVNPRLHIAADGSVFEWLPAHFYIHYTGRRHRLNVHSHLKQTNRPHLPIAFFLQISEPTLPHLVRLLINIWHSSNTYVIHLDAKIPHSRRIPVQRAIARVTQFANVYFIPSDPITYKGISMLLNTLDAISFLLTVQRPWTYFINLSGADYPLVNTVVLSHMLALPNIADRGLSFLQIAVQKRFWRNLKKSRFDQLYYDTALTFADGSDSRLVERWARHPYSGALGLDFVQAEAWIIAHRSLAEYSVRSAFSRKLLVLLSNMQDPEEHFFAMLAWNSPTLNATLAHHAFRAIYWEKNGEMSGQHPYYVDEEEKDSSLPFWSAILSSPSWFVRKVKNPDSRLLDEIDRMKSGTHSNAHNDSVSNSIAHARRFMTCIAQADPTSDKIRSYNVCR